MNCIVEDRTGAFLDELESISIVETAADITISWDTTTAHTDQQVQLAHRLSDNSDAFAITEVSRDSGEAIATPLVSSTEYTIWIRPITSTKYGRWQSMTATTI